eukprot:6463314-Amphidinium_carterae.1
MKNLYDSGTNGIVLLVGGTGCGKSSVSPPALYVDTILSAHGRDQRSNPFLPSELRPGGRILITEPRKALTRSMVGHLKNINRSHEFLFGYQYAGASSSPNHDEAILYMTDGIAVAHLMSMVSDVMTMVRRERERPCNGVLDPSAMDGIQRAPWDPEFPIVVIDECHLRSVNCDVTIALVRWLQSVGVPIVLLLMSATANEKDFAEKLELASDMILRIQGQPHPVSRFLLGQTITSSLMGKPDDPPPGGPSPGGGRRTDMAILRGIVQAVMQITLHDKLWSERNLSKQYVAQRKGIDILVFLPGTAEISLLASTIECLVKGGYMTAVKVYKINARVDQKTIAELNQRANSWDWVHQTYANQVTWDLVDKANRNADEESLAFLFKPNSYPARRVLLSTEAVNAGITLPYVEWVISSMG